MASLKHCLILIFVYQIQTATISTTNDTVQTLKNDVAQVGSAVENLTFDLIREMIDNPETMRKKRSLEGEVTKLCTQKCQEAQQAQMEALRMEVAKLQETVMLLQDERKMNTIIDNATMINGPPMNDLGKMKQDLTGMIMNLKNTQIWIEEQEKKNFRLEHELKKQRDEIKTLNIILTGILNKNDTGDEDTRLRSSNDDLKKLLKGLPDDEEDDDELRAKIKDLQKHLSKKRREESLMKELKDLGKELNDNNDNQMLKQLIKALKPTEPQSKTDNLNINNLDDLQDAINRLRPKEDSPNQFQAALNQLISPSGNQVVTPPAVNINRPTISGGVTLSPSQMTELAKKICVSPPNRYQFFPPQAYYPSNGYASPNYERQYGGAAETPEVTRKYEEDLKQQIDGLQSAIDNLSRPEYGVKTEDRSMVENLEHQIGDLRNLVNNLNYDQAAPSYRRKRSLMDNNVDKDILQQLFQDDKKTELENLQTRINQLKKQIDFSSESAQIRSSPLYEKKELKISHKTDVFTFIVAKILDKIIASIPVIIKKLFGFTVDELLTGEYYHDYDVQILAKSFGNLAFLPMIPIKLLKGLGAFFRILKKNHFFKNFVLPALTLGVIAGHVLFLIWWLQPEEKQEYYNQHHGGKEYYQEQKQYYDDRPNQYPASYKNQVYNKHYYSYNKDDY